MMFHVKIFVSGNIDGIVHVDWLVANSIKENTKNTIRMLRSIQVSHFSLGFSQQHPIQFLQHHTYA